jgi:Mor family transcriptional regulator
MELIERFWSKVEIKGTDECWPWKAGTWKKGSNLIYGEFQLNNKPVSAHRVAYMIANGKALNKTLVIRHKCDNPICCNPYHLEEGTKADNAQDCINRGRWPDKKGEKSSNHKISNKEVMEIRDRCFKGESRKKIAKLYGLSIGNISTIVRGKSWTDSFDMTKYKRYEHSPYAKLTIKEVLEIREKKLSGRNVIEIAKEYFVSKSTIYKIISGIRWSSI